MYNLKRKIIEECSRFNKKSISTEIPAFTIFDSEGKDAKLNHNDKTSSIPRYGIRSFKYFSKY